jgi:glucosylceramidase
MAVGLGQFVSLIPARAQGRRASVWVTSGDRSRLLEQQPDVPFVSDTTSPNLTIDVRADQVFQQIEGFGASLTESSAWLLATALTDGERATLMTQFFHPVFGIGLDVLRQPIGASDFALSHYSYDDMPAGQRDPALQQFSIARDRTYVIPAVRQAIQLNPGLRVMATPWSAPGWMKTLGSMIRGELKRENYAPYAAYFVKFLQAYAAEGIQVETVTVQNEPHFTAEDYPGMYMTSADQVTFVRDYLAPAFSQAHLTTKILAFDQNWNEANYPLEVFSDAGARAVISGSAFHCYAGNPSAMTSVHASYPDKSIHVTECSLFAGTTPTFTDSLIWTTRALLIGSLRNWAQTVITWNLVLDQQYGPHTGGCIDCTGLATIDRGTGRATLNGEFYALAHVSKFVQRGADRIESTTFGSQGVDDVAFRNPDGSYVLVVSNSWQTGAIKVRFGGESFTFALAPGSVATFTWPGGAPPPPPPGQVIPGRIEAEDFNDGGEGRGYHDSTAGNTGGQYRNTDVDIEATSDVGGGYNVGWMKAGEWLEYSIDVANAGTFTVEAQVASNGPGGGFHIEVNGVDKTGRMTIPDTRGWQSWVTLTRTNVPLEAGAQRLRVIVDANGATGDAGNLNYLRFTAANPTPPPTAPTPFGGTAAAVPGTIEAENFDNGGESVAYHDLSASNLGGQYRAGDVDIEATTDTGGGYNVGWLQAGEWLKYTVNVTTAGTYTLDVRVAANGSGGTFHVESNDVDVTGPMAFPNTGSWQTWRSRSQE